MFRKTLLSTLTAAVLATSAFSTTAQASDFGHEVLPVSQKLRGKDVAAGLALGAAVVILGAIASEKNSHGGFRNGKNKRRHHNVDFDDDVECFEKPVYKFSRKLRREVIVDIKTICR